MISQQTIQEIISKINIIDIINDFVPLKKRGANYLGHCPFHHERTPSFTVSPSKDIYKCFGCGKSGNAINFIMEHEKLSYVDTLKWLAKKYHITLIEENQSEEKIIQQKNAESIAALVHFSMELYTQQLFHTEEGKRLGLTYLEARGFHIETIKKFHLGYAPSTSNTLTEALKKNQFHMPYAIQCGLCKKQANEPYTDNYRERIIFPIHNAFNKVVGFSARTLKNTEEQKIPKYINSPENELFFKSKLLYGLQLAKTSILKKNECLLVEGYTDVISLHQAGFENVVCSGGTSLTIDQIRLIKKYTKNILIIFDGDSAGMKASERAISLALEEGLHIHLALIPDKEDPDGFIKKRGKAAFQDLLENHKKDFLLFKIEMQKQAIANDVNKKNDLVNAIAQDIAQINRLEDFAKQDYYIKKSAALLHINESHLHHLVNKYLRDKISKVSKKIPLSESEALLHQTKTPIEREKQSFINMSLKPTKSDIEKKLLQLLLTYGEHVIDDKKNYKVAHLILETCQNGQLIDNKDIKKIIDIYLARLQEKQECLSLAYFMYHQEDIIRETITAIHFNDNHILLHQNKATEDDTNIMKDIHFSMSIFKLRHLLALQEENNAQIKAIGDNESLETSRQEHLLMAKEIKKQLAIVNSTLGITIMK